MHNHFKMCLTILISSQKPLLLFSSKLPYTTNKQKYLCEHYQNWWRYFNIKCFLRSNTHFCSQTTATPYIYIYICAKLFLMGVKFWKSWGVAQTIFKITLLLTFLKNGIQLDDPRGYFETKFQGWFFFVLNNFYVDFFCKIEGKFNFLVNFFLVRNFKEISHLKLKPIPNFCGNCSE